MRNVFVDEVRITARAGDGGAGLASFDRGKNRPRGRPDGGDGGRGGSVVVTADTSVGSLAPFVHRRLHRAAPGGAGGPNRRTGAVAEDVVLRVPVGTIVRDAPSGELLADLARPETSYVVARGGSGGRGNAGLRGAGDRHPNYAEHGEPGEEHVVDLELRLVADVGLLGPPNAGKSTLLGTVSRADPKVAPYPFTTLDPGLGVVEWGDDNFVVADLPGLIEGASEGKGLGLRFLRHATRCRVLAAVVDLSAPDPAADLTTVRREVEGYDLDLASRLRVVVGNKTDLQEAETRAARRWADGHGAAFLAVSAAMGSGIEELTELLAAEVDRARAEQGEPRSFAVFRPVAADRVAVTREGEGYRVHSSRAEQLVARTPIDNPRAVRRLQRRLRSMGVERALEREGAREGDDILIGEVTFEFYPEDGPETGARDA